MIVNLIVNECQFEKYLLFGLEERHVAGNPKQKDLRRVTAFFCRVKVGLMGSGAASLEDGIKDTYSLEVKGGGIFLF